MKTFKLHPVTQDARRNKFCGPAAISILTGCTAGEAAYLIRTLPQRSATPVKATYTGEVLAALRDFGLDACAVARSWYADIKTLADFVANFPQRAECAYLINVGHHWVVIRGSQYACGISKVVTGLSDPVAQQYARKQVRAVFQISGTVQKPSRPTKGTPVKRGPDYKVKLRKLVEAGTIKPIERDSIGGGEYHYWVFPGDWIINEEKDPAEGARIRRSWFEVLRLAESYHHLRVTGEWLGG